MKFSMNAGIRIFQLLFSSIIVTLFYFRKRYELSAAKKCSNSVTIDDKKFRVYSMFGSLYFNFYLTYIATIECTKFIIHKYFHYNYYYFH